MTKFYLLRVELPDWADKQSDIAEFRGEIATHAEATLTFYTRAVNVTAKCEPLKQHADCPDVFFAKP